MKTRSILVGLCLAASLLATGGKVHAQITNFPVINVNEAGSGTLEFPIAPPPVILLTGVLAADPGPGGLPSALTYNLPSVVPNLVAGDVVLQEVVGTALISDIIRFNPAGTGGPNSPPSLVLYSDNSDGVDSRADTGFPLLRYPNTLILPETGPETGPNGLFGYTPTANQPGFISGFAVTYNITSDSAIPEPASLVMMGIGLAAVAGLAWRRHRSRDAR